MIRHEVVTSKLHGFPGQSAPDYWGCPAFRTQVLWLDARSIVLHDMTGDIDLALWRELLAWLLGQGIATVHAERKPGHRLPGEQPSALGPQWRRIDIAALRTRTRQPDSPTTVPTE